MKVFFAVCSFALCTVHVHALQQATPTKTYSSYRPAPFCSPSDYFRYPTSLEDVVSIVREAIDNHKTVKAFGAKHSQTDIICTEGIPIETYGLNWKSLDPTTFVVTLGSGVILREATQFLREKGRALKTTPAYGNLTIGGAIGTGAHGSTLKYNASISSQVVGLTIVDGKGKVRKISSPEDLKAFRIHLGLLGIVVSVDIETHPLYKTTAFNQVISDSILTDGTLSQKLKFTDQATLYWFPSFQQVVVANWTIVDVSTPGDAFTYDHVPSTNLLTNTGLRQGGEGLQTLASDTCPHLAAVGYAGLEATQLYFENTLLRQIPQYVPIYTEDGETLRNPATGYYDLMFAPTCSEDPQSVYQCIWAHNGSNVTILDNEFTIALSDFSGYVNRVKAVLKKLPGVFPVQGIVLRFSAASDIYMSTAYERDSVHFEWYMINRLDRNTDPGASLAVYQVMAQIATREFGARGHWGKTGMVYQNSEMLNLKLNSSARAAFIKKMDEYDPNGIFLNNFGRRLKGTGMTLDVDPTATRCALQDYCFCTSNAHCATKQECNEFPGYPHYKTCRTHNDTKVLELLPLYHFSMSNPTNFSLEDFASGIPEKVKQAAAACAIK